MNREPSARAEAAREVVGPQGEKQWRPVDRQPDDETPQPGDTSDRRREHTAEQERHEHVARGRNPADGNDDVRSEAEVREDGCGSEQPAKAERTDNGLAGAIEDDQGGRVSHRRIVRRC
jgi:hypothetical protein